MRILPLNLGDTATIRACHEVSDAATRADDSCEPPRSAAVFLAGLTSSWHGSPREAWIAVGEADGTVAAWYQAEFPDLENLDRVPLNLVVHPARRRGGLGTALLRHAASRAAASGRAVLDGGVQEGSAGEAFALRFGAESGMENIRRVLDLEKLPAGKLTRLREAAAKAAAGYSLVRWEGVTPTRGSTRSHRCLTR
jgi:GNAT superfamily N-acetyltransferase